MIKATAPAAQTREAREAREARKARESCPAPETYKRAKEPSIRRHDNDIFT